jgi:hypothetical protein
MLSLSLARPALASAAVAAKLQRHGALQQGLQVRVDRRQRYELGRVSRQPEQRAFSTTATLAWPQVCRRAMLTGRKYMMHGPVSFKQHIKQPPSEIRLHATQGVQGFNMTAVYPWALAAGVAFLLYRIVRFARYAFNMWFVSRSCISTRLLQPCKMRKLHGLYQPSSTQCRSQAISGRAGHMWTCTCWARAQHRGRPLPARWCGSQEPAR